MRYLFWIFLIFILSIRLIIFYTLKSTYPDGTKFRITDKVTSEPIRYSKAQYLKLQGFKIYLPPFPELSYGDKVVIEGEVFNDPEKAGINLRKVKLVKVEEADSLLYLFRERLIAFYSSVLPQPHSALISGVTLGSKSSIPPKFWESLKKSGTAHIVVASGMNVALVSGFLMGIMTIYFRRRNAIPLAIAGTWIYALMSGFDAPIIRAAIMGSLVFTTEILGRVSTALKLLLITAVGMLIFKPEWLTDLGFLLSFFATASLLLLEKKVYRLLKFVPEGLGIFKKDLSTSLTAQIGVAPILFATFGQFSPLSPLINALILWTIVPMTILGMVGGLLGLIFEPAGTFVLWLVYPLTSWFIGIINLMTN